MDRQRQRARNTSILLQTYSHSFINEHYRPLRINSFLTNCFIDIIICTITSGMRLFTHQPFGNEGKNEGIQADSLCLGALSQLDMD